MPILHISRRLFHPPSDWFLCSDIGITFWLPSHWQRLPAGTDGVQQISTPDNGLVILLMTMESKQLDVLLQEVGTMLLSSIDQLSYTHKELTTINGLHTFVLHGDARTEHIPISLSLYFVKHNGQILMLLCMANAQAEQDYQTARQQVFSSIQPAADHFNSPNGK